MLELEENLRALEELLKKLNSLEEALNISDLKKELEKLQKISSEDGFWENKEKSSEIFSKIKKIEKKINKFYELKNNLDSLIEMNKLLSTDFDEELGKDLITQTNIISKKLENLELETLLSGKYDGNNAILSLHPRSWPELNHKTGFKCYIECI